MSQSLSTELHPQPLFHLTEHTLGVFWFLSLWLRGALQQLHWQQWEQCFLFMLSHVQLFVTVWTVTLQAPLSMGFPRQEHWSGLPFPTLGDVLNPGIESKSPMLAGQFFTTEPPGKPYIYV